jgi:hypothetical protein
MVKFGTRDQRVMLPSVEEFHENPAQVGTSGKGVLINGVAL